MTKLSVLGCGDAFNSGGRRHSAFLLEVQGAKIMLDCGATTVLALKQLGINYEDLDCVIITHFHGDHYGGLPYLLLEAAKIQKRSKPLILVSPHGMEERLSILVGLLYPGSNDILQSFPIQYRTFLKDETLDLPFGGLTAFRLRHVEKTLPHGVRLELGDKVIAYSGDTGWHDNLIPLAEGADIFICECNFFENQTSSHLDYLTLKQKMKRLKSKRIFLTHLGEEMLERRNEIDLEVLVDGQQIEF